MASTFRELSEDFNTCASGLARSGKSAETILTRYFVLLNHKAQTDDERSATVTALFDGGMSLLRRYAARNDNNLYGTTVTNAVKIFDALQKPESLNYLPQRAEQELADVAFALAAKADALTSDEFGSYSSFDNCREATISLSKIALKAAETAKAAMAERTIDIKTSKPITPAKRIVLKTPDGGAPD
jgi:hypothetical protein